MVTHSRTGAQPGRWRRFLQSLSGSLEMPRDVLLHVPRATLTGTMHLQVENHQGLVRFEPTCVRISTREGEVVVTGRRLKIGKLYQDEVVVEGQIERVEWVDGPRLPPPKDKKERTS